MYIKIIFVIILPVILTACSMSSQTDRKVIISDGNTKQWASCQPWDYSCHTSSTQDRLSLQQLQQKNHAWKQDIDYRAPDFVGLDNWINSAAYDSLTQLEGKVVLIDFWTQSCSKCIHSISYLNRFYDLYEERWLEIIWIHSPTYAYDQRLDVLENAVKKHGITYPVVQDNDFMTWKAYENRYWPSYYLIDTQGIVRFEQFWQGWYDDLEQAIQDLLPR